MQLIIAGLWLVALPFTLGSTCTASGALSWPPTGFSPSPTSGGCSDPNTSIVDCCASVAGNDPVALQACLKAGGLGDGTVSPREKLKARNTLTCTSSETCYQYIDGSLLCLDKSTGLYHDDIGGTGNYNTGEYTAPDGSVTTDLVGAPATPTASKTSTRRTSPTSASPTTTHSTDGTNIRASTSESGTIASATSASLTSSSRTAGATGFYAGAGAGAIAGALGVVVRLVL